MPPSAAADGWEQTLDQIEGLLQDRYMAEAGWVGATVAPGDDLRHRDIEWFRLPRQHGVLTQWIFEHDSLAVRLTTHAVPSKAEQWGHLTMWQLRPTRRSHEVRSVEGGSDLRRHDRRVIQFPRADRLGSLGEHRGEVGVIHGVRVRNASSISRSTMAWVWRRRIPEGMVTVLDGDPGVGKSTLTIDIAARLSAGRPMPDASKGQAPTGVVLMSAEDDPAHTIKPRLEAAGADLARVGIVEGRIDEHGNPALLSLPYDLPALQAIVAEYQARLVVIDPLVAFLGSDVDSHRDQSVRSAMSALRTLAEESGSAVLVLRHLTKGSGGVNAVYRGGGSIGIVAHARAGLLLARHPKDKDLAVLHTSKLNVGKIGPALSFRVVPWVEDEAWSHLVWEGAVDISPEELLEGPSTDHRREPRNLARDWLLTLLADGWVTAKRIEAEAKKAGITDATLIRARKELRKEGLIDTRKEKAGWKWGLT